MRGTQLAPKAVLGAHSSNEQRAVLLSAGGANPLFALVPGGLPQKVSDTGLVDIFVKRHSAKMASDGSDVVSNGQGAAQDSREPDREDSVTLQEILEEEDSLQADAAAVLGASDAKSCSYIKGYVDRQALYACATCAPHPAAAGVCLACSYACHDGHELYELYTKRNFRCDCGNSKFPNTSCSLYPAKAAVNSENSYNQNFSGKYCRCSRPYPDPERSDPEEMLQCIVCEDWFHLSHIGLKTANSDDFEELICDGCMKAHQFLWKYNKLAKEKETGSVVDVTTPPNDDVEPNPKKARLEKIEKNGEKPPTDTSSEKLSSSSGSTSPSCILATLSDVEPLPTSGAVWPKSWRSDLCSCSSCGEMYLKQNLSFLARADDTMGSYEERGLRKRREDGAQEDPLMTALNKMDHVVKIDLIDGYNNLKSCLTEFLRKQASQNKVVTARDIKNFFEELQKKRKSSAAPVLSYMCR
ncbi:putative E3 ubiquitin-protein ligase UBR7-like [Tropilaelaps mercedesae]|uniref:Putative E3 ubiquitin-protein ligase UBR7-like n=1 Tax=Tropilaelaps mercedesae TaxID=418985 RepID=A0A1V9X634_9ACAR|nr:putative E3 ubiquitin-protein ligase UBR7-like [Tropilaelaps mercedesae]